MMQKSLVLILFTFFLLPTSKGNTVFDEVYLKWATANKNLVKTNLLSHSISRYSQVVFDSASNEYFVEHKMSSEKTYAVEWLFSANNKDQASLERTLVKQMAGYFLWALKTKHKGYIWHLAQSNSITVKPELGSFKQTDIPFLIQTFDKEGFQFTEEDKKGQILLSTEDSNRKFTVQITPKMIDIIGGSSFYFTDYIYQQTKDNLIAKKLNNFDESKGIPTELFVHHIEPIGNANKTSNQFTPIFFDFPIAKDLAYAWLYKSFKNEMFLETSKLDIGFVNRDTLHIESETTQIAELLNVLQSNLSFLGEFKEIGLVRAEKMVNGLQQIRFMLLFRHEELGYEHIVRIDHEITVYENEENWNISNTKALVMLVNPIMSHLK